MSTEPNPNEWKEILAVGLSIALIILAIGGCSYMGGRVAVKFSDPDPAATKGQP